MPPLAFMLPSPVISSKRSAAFSFHAANGGAPFGFASLRPLPESTASSLRDNLYLQGPSPCTLRGWICPPHGSTKALWSQRFPGIMRGCASLCHFERNTKCGVEKSISPRASLGRNDKGTFAWPRRHRLLAVMGKYGGDGEVWWRR